MKSATLQHAGIQRLAPDLGRLSLNPRTAHRDDGRDAPPTRHGPRPGIVRDRAPRRPRPDHPRRCDHARERPDRPDRHRDLERAAPSSPNPDPPRVIKRAISKYRAKGRGVDHRTYPATLHTRILTPDLTS